MAEREGEDLNLTDYENWLLARFKSHEVQGLERLANEKRVAHIKADLSKSEWSWEQYSAYVNAGYGDKWFFDEDRPPGPLWGEGVRPPGKNWAE